MGSLALTVLTLCTFVVASIGLKTLSTSRLRLQQDLSLNLTDNPVRKVVHMLQDMKIQLTKDMEDDKAVMEKMGCWCKKNKEEKEAAIEGGSQHSKDLSSEISICIGQISEFTTKKSVCLAELNKDIEALQKARELRLAENKEFHATEVGLMESIAAVRNAIIVLEKHHTADFPQFRAAAHVLLKHESSLNSLGIESAELLKSFLHGAESATSFLSIPGYKSFSPQSSQIFGILKQMREQFENDLSAARKEEEKAVQEFEELKKAKEDEIAGGKVTLTRYKTTLSMWIYKKSQYTTDLNNTDVQFALDTEFLRKLKIKCSQSEADFDARMKDRMDEIVAVEETIKILNSDEAFATFEKMAAASSFLQTSAMSKKEEQARRHRAVAVLQKAAAKSSTAQLALILASVQLDSFTKVIAAIDGLVVEFKKQQAEEVTQKDNCNGYLLKNQKDTEAENDKKEMLVAKIADLTKTNDTTAKDIKTAVDKIAELKAQMADASETREAQKTDFETTVQDNRLMSMILQKAMDRMKQVYALLQQPGAPHIVTSGTATDPGNGPARFTKYEASASGGHVVKMLEEMLADLKKTEVDALNSEKDAQGAYDEFMKDSERSVMQTNKALTALKGSHAATKSEIISTKQDLKSTMTMLEQLNKESGDIHAMCDFLLKNFDARQSARSAEIEALGDAKAILKGSS